jgi:hypothetical protein
MKHIKLFEQFLGEKMLAKDLKKLAVEISLKIPSLPGFTKFKPTAAKTEINDRLVSFSIPDAPKLSNIGNFKENFMRLNRNQTSFIEFRNDEGVQLFRIVYVINRRGKGLYGNTSVDYTNSFQIIVGDNYKVISPVMSMILPDVIDTDAAEVFKDHLNKALNSPGFVELIKQYAEAVKAVNS